MANNHRFSWIVQASTVSSGEFTNRVNEAMRALVHDVQSQVVFNDHLPRTITAAHAWSVPLKLNPITAPATIANVGQFFVDTADGKLKFLGGNGTLTPIADP